MMLLVCRHCTYASLSSHIHMQPDAHEQLVKRIAYLKELNETSNVSSKVKLARPAGKVPVKELLASCIPCSPAHSYCLY